MTLNKCVKSVLILLPLILCGCDSGSYTAIGFSRINRGTSFSMTFFSFKGYYNATLNEISSDHMVSYELSLEEGEANIYYKWGTFDKELLVTIHGGENLTGSAGYVSSGYKTKIIIETVETCKNGSFEFNLLN